MKKTLSIILMILIGGFFAFTGCEDDETTDPGTTPKATIKGTVYTDFDLSNANTNEDNAPQGTKIFFRIDAADLVTNPNPTYDYQTLQYEATVDADGNYSISVPVATHAAVNVEVQADQFEHEFTNAVGDSEETYFQAGAMNVAAKNGETHYMDIYY